jgi:hypothetical protein
MPSAGAKERTSTPSAGIFGKDGQARRRVSAVVGGKRRKVWREGFERSRVCQMGDDPFGADVDEVRCFHKVSADCRAQNVLFRRGGDGCGRKGERHAL